MAIGFSTGAVAFPDFRAALEVLDGHPLTAIELSALRFAELSLLIQFVGAVDLGAYGQISVHAPNDFSPEEEADVADALLRFAADRWPIVVHPDVIVDWQIWQGFGEQLLVENMDPRRALGRNVAELSRVFDRLPDARLCFDVAHARRVDTSMLEAFLILDNFSDRLAEVHVSELDAACRHHRLSHGGVAAIREVSSLIPHHIPAIIEAPVQPSEIDAEIAASLEALGRAAPLRHAA